MNKLTFSLFGASLMAVLASLPLNAEDQTQTQQQVQTEEQPAQRVYGWQLMTEQERQDHRQHMRSLKTEQERQQYREEHHKAMQARAKERGVSLPDEPLNPGPGPGGGGMGPGGGGMGGGGMGGGMRK